VSVPLVIDPVTPAVALAMGPGYRFASLDHAPDFVWADASLMIHRPRSATVVSRGGRHAQTTYRAWCGQVFIVFPGKPEASARLSPNPPKAGKPFCATCEGRAAGAGQAGTGKFNGRPVLFRPRGRRMGGARWEVT
jgi:hypothetical protein